MRSPDYYLNLVEEFHQAFHYCYPSPTSPELTDKARNELRLKLLREEIKETNAAIKAADRIGILDGLCDYQYVLSGAILALGMRQECEEFGLIRVSSPFTPSTHLGVWEEILEMGLHAGHVTLTTAGLSMLQSLTFKCVRELGFEAVFDEAFKSVHESNMSKLWRREDAKQMEIVGGYTCQQTEGVMVIVKRADGKIMKSPTYKPVDLSRFIYGDVAV
jgi:hypothetical protein